MSEPMVISNTFWIVISFLQIFLSFLMIITLLRIKVYWWVTLAYSIILAPLTFENPWIMLAIFVAGAFIFYFFTAKRQWQPAVLAMILHLFSSVAIASLMQFSSLALSYLFEIEYVFFRIISVVFYIFLLGIIIHKKFTLTNLIHSKVIFTVSPLMFLISCAIFLYMPLRGEVFDTAYLLDSLFRLIIKLSVTYMALIINKFSAENEKLEFYSLYTDTLKESLDHLSMFKHDYRDIINTLFGFCRLKQWDKIEPFLKGLCADIHRDITAGAINSQLKDNMPYLYGIVLAKSTMAAAEGIMFDIIIIANKFKLFTISEVQLSRVVGNLLNNAFDAARQCEHKEVTLHISNFDDYRIRIQVTNSVTALVDTTNILNKGFTTKEGHTGLGLYQVYAVIDRQIEEGFNVKIYFYNNPGNTFTAELFI